MKTVFRRFRSAAMLAVVALSTFSAVSEKVPDIQPGFALPDMQRLSNNVYVARFSPRLWVHTTVGTLDNGVRYTANGMLLEQGNTSILFDAGWTPDETRTLLRWAREVLKHPVARAYVTHFHSDRVIGATVLEEQHIPVFATSLTVKLAKKNGEAVPDHAIPVPSTPTEVAKDAILYFPGAGHTRDNIVVDFPAEKIVFGGCFIKAANADGIGNIADADLKAWPASVKRMQAAFPHTRLVVPGHGPVRKGAVERTLKLLRKEPSRPQS